MERDPLNMLGMPVIVMRDTSTTVRRTWRERLFTRPWRPFLKWRVVVSPSPVPRDKCYQMGGKFYCGVDFYEALKAKASNAG